MKNLKQAIHSSYKQIFCCECQQKVDAVLMQGNEAYPHLGKLLKYKHFWQCPNCKNFVGTYPNSEKHAPLGTIPNLAMKRARAHTHHVIDKLWKEKLISRQELYNHLSKKFGYDFHVGHTRTVQECWQAIQYAKEYKQELLKA